MSLNVNEMELKDPTQRTFGFLQKKKETGRVGGNMGYKKKTQKKMKCQVYRGYVHLRERKHLIS